MHVDRWRMASEGLLTLATWSTGGKGVRQPIAIGGRVWEAVPRTFQPTCAPFAASCQPLHREFAPDCGAKVVVNGDGCRGMAARLT
jgi:hypothetical protein